MPGRPNRREQKRREASAYHEAGHAVAAYLLKRRFPALALTDGDGAAPCCFADVPAFQPDLSAIPIHMPQMDAQALRVRHYVEKLISVYLAGYCAEKRHAGRASWDDCPADLRHAAELLRYVASADERERAAYLDWLAERARVLLADPQHWEATQAVALALLEHGRLTERRAKSVIDATMLEWVERQRQGN